MNIVAVEFEGSPNKRYYFYTNLKLIIGGIYEIVADDKTTYDNRVKIIANNIKFRDCFYGLRTITSAKLLQAPPKPLKPYKKIIVNVEKEVICVLWRDGTKTIMKPQPEDIFDVEKGIAMCFMKKVYGNRGCFNDAFRDFEVVKNA